MARLDTLADNEAVTDAVGLLTRDHRLIEELFREFTVAGDQQVDPLARRICKMLRIHAQILDEIFYPVARRALSDQKLIDAAAQGHKEAKQSIMLIESLSSEDAAFRPAVRALAEEFNQHVASEERELFPKVRAANVDLLGVGLTLSERRDTLMDVLGLHADDEEAAVYPTENPAIALAAAAREQRAKRMN